MLMRRRMQARHLSEEMYLQYSVAGSQIQFCKICQRCLAFGRGQTNVGQYVKKLLACLYGDVTQKPCKIDSPQNKCLSINVLGGRWMMPDKVPTCIPQVMPK